MRELERLIRRPKIDTLPWDFDEKRDCCMVFLETERLVLRNLRVEDVDVMYDYRNNEVCARYQRGQAKERAEIAALVERRKVDVIGVDAPFMLAVALKESDEMVGESVVMPKEGTISMGYTISYRHHRKGYAFEALAALTALLHERYPDCDFVCFTEKENEPSKALLRKLGYRDMGYAPRKESEVFGKWLKPETEEEIVRAVDTAREDGA